ncbi:hypothetical protein L596_001627 [Steinernema carpocapsae]|uniref:Uncharacterized protein n=1 Tax=Steinernema carpocapsae TaxID=34508 RepID=A0A4U8UMS8_STECR|nr:hypothetical protein L596_001627 [Steinernema carpocapsae]
MTDGDVKIATYFSNVGPQYTVCLRPQPVPCLLHQNHAVFVHALVPGSRERYRRSTCGWAKIPGGQGTRDAVADIVKLENNSEDSRVNQRFLGVYGSFATVA